MKRRIIPLLLALLALSGCGGGDQPIPVPPTPTAVATPAPTPEPAKEWWEVLDRDKLPVLNDEMVVLDDDSQLWCLSELAQPDISLYCLWVPQEDFPQLWLRYDAHFERLAEDLSPGFPLEPILIWADFDRDGAEELLVTLRSGQASTLTIYRWDGAWTAQPYTGYSDDLLRVLGSSVEEQTLTVTYGQDSVRYTPGPNDRGTVSLVRDFSDYSFFSISGTDISAVFGVGAFVSDSIRYFGTVIADVEYRDGVFTLRDIRLLAAGGV